MANKIRSLELEKGLIANFLDGGMIELLNTQTDQRVKIHDGDLKTILDTAKSNAKANGVVEVNKESPKS